MRIIQGVLLLIFLGAVLIFALSNNQVVQLRFLQWTSIPTPLPALAAGLYLLGMLSGWTVVAFVRGSLRKIAERPRHEDRA